MDEPLRIIGQPEADDDNTAVPFAIEDWLTAPPDRQTLLIGANESAAAARIDQFVENISRHGPIGAEVLHLPGDPLTLPYESGRFDLAICAFLSAEAEINNETVAEISRVIRPGGRLLIIDNLVPGSRLRGKKARQLRLAGEWVNAWVRLRNPQHKRYLSQDAWTCLLRDGQWNFQQMASGETAQDFDTWADHYSPSANNRIRLQAMLLQAPEKVHRFLTPQESGDRIAFRMTKVFILTTKT